MVSSSRKEVKRIGKKIWCCTCLHKDLVSYTEGMGNHYKKENIVMDSNCYYHAAVFSLYHMALKQQSSYKCSWVVITWLGGQLNCMFDSIACCGFEELLQQRLPRKDAEQQISKKPKLFWRLCWLVPVSCEIRFRSTFYHYNQVRGLASFYSYIVGTLGESSVNYAIGVKSSLFWSSDWMGIKML